MSVLHDLRVDGGMARTGLHEDLHLVWAANVFSAFLNCADEERREEEKGRKFSGIEGSPCQSVSSERWRARWCAKTFRGGKRKMTQTVKSSGGQKSAPIQTDPRLMARWTYPEYGEIGGALPRQRPSSSLEVNSGKNLSTQRQMHDRHSSPVKVASCSRPLNPLLHCSSESSFRLPLPLLHINHFHQRQRLTSL